MITEKAQELHIQTLNTKLSQYQIVLGMYNILYYYIDFTIYPNYISVTYNNNITYKIHKKASDTLKELISVIVKAQQLLTIFYPLLSFFHFL